MPGHPAIPTSWLHGLFSTIPRDGNGVAHRLRRDAAAGLRRDAAAGSGGIRPAARRYPDTGVQHTRDRERQEFDMSDTLDWNAKTIAEVRANEGRVGGTFEGAPLVLVHHRGRKSGREYVNPMMYVAHDTEPDIIYVFATKGGAP